MSSSEGSISHSRGIGVIRLVIVACVCFLAGMTFKTDRSLSTHVEAASDHLYELMIYHALPGKATALTSVFEGVAKLQAKYGLHAVGYWVPNDSGPEWQDTFIYLLSHSDRQSADNNWKALHADPAFEPFFKAAAPLTPQRNGKYLVDQIYMTPTAYSDSK